MKVYSPIRNLEQKESRRYNSIIIEQQLLNQELSRQNIYQNQRREEQIYHLKRQLNQSRRQAQTDINLLIGENQRLKTQLSALNYQLKDHHEFATARELKSNQINQNLCQETVYLQKQNKELKINISARNIEIENLSTQKNYLNQQIQSLKFQLNQVYAENQNLNRQKLNLANQNQTLKLDLNSKNIEVQNTNRQKIILQENYQNQLQFFKRENENLQKRLLINQEEQMTQLDKLKNKYVNLHIGDTDTLKDNYGQQIKYLITEIDKLKQLLNDKSLQLQLYFQQRKQIKQRYDNELGNKISQINLLKNQLLIQQVAKNNEIKQQQTKKQLERSRAVGIIQNSKQSTNYLQGEIRKLTEEITRKNFQLQNLTKNYLSECKKNEDLNKNSNDKILSMIRQHQQSLMQKINQYQKRQNILKQQIVDLKKKESKLNQKIQNLQKQLQVKQHQYSILNSSFENAQNQIKQLKIALQKQREQHLKELNKVMIDKTKRKGSSRMLSSKSLNDSNQFVQPNLNPDPQPKLPVVKEQQQKKQSLQQSRDILQVDDMQPQQDDLQRLKNHYESIIQELKKTNNNQIQLLKMQNQRYKQKLNQKTQQNYQILNKFSPLVKIHANQKTLEEDRRQRINRHWKADVNLLSVLLDKNKIRTN